MVQNCHGPSSLRCGLNRPDFAANGRVPNTERKHTQGSSIESSHPLMADQHGFGYTRYGKKMNGPPYRISVSEDLGGYKGNEHCTEPKCDPYNRRYLLFRGNFHHGCRPVPANIDDTKQYKPNDATGMLHEPCDRDRFASHPRVVADEDHGVKKGDVAHHPSTIMGEAVP